MTTVSIQEAKDNLSELIHGLAPGDEVLIMENDRTVAKLVTPPQTPIRQPRRPGTLRGSVLYMAPDFDAPLDESDASIPLPEWVAEEAVRRRDEMVRDRSMGLTHDEVWRRIEGRNG